MNTHKVYTREQLEALTANELDEVYFYLVGYRPMQDDGISRSECIELILEQYDEIEKHKPATIEQPSPVSAHTPGPWVWSDKGTHSELLQKDTSGEDSILYHAANWKIKESDKRLISLAPETAKERDELKKLSINQQDDINNLNEHIRKVETLNAEMLEVLQQIANCQPRTNKKGWIDPIELRGIQALCNSLLSRARQ